MGSILALEFVNAMFCLEIVRRADEYILAARFYAFFFETHDDCKDVLVNGHRLINGRALSFLL